MFSNILGGAAGFPVADLGDEVNQSVRFYGTQRLTRTFANNSGNTWTWSAWLKKTSNNTRDQIIFGTVSPLQFTMARSNNFGWTQATVANFETAVRRDTNAWYHRVDVSDGTDLKMYINGVLVQTWSQASTGVNTNVEHFLGGDFANRSSEMWDGYIAQVYFIDGTAIGDTDGVIDEFGRYQEDGVWVPDSYTGTYGTNGFHLDFADSSDLGNDVSGNNNDFTANGFDTADVVLYSKDLFTSTNTSINVNSTDTNFAGGSGQEFAFDGNTALASNTSATSNSAIVFRPSTPISNVTQIEVNYSAAVSGTIAGYNGGNETSAAASGYNQIYSGSAITVNNIYVRNSNQTFLAAIRINGSTVLTDNTDNDVDFNDTPTSNYATLNPLFNAADHTPRYFGITKDANLAADTSGSEADYATTSNIELTDGKWYFEVTYTTRALVGIAGGDDRQNNRAFIEAETGNYTTQNSFGTSGPTSNSGSQTSGTIGCRVDITNRTLSFTWDGSTYTSNLTYSDPGHKIFPYISAGAQQPTNNTIQINHGQMPFIYSVPTGFEGNLQTNNLPEPTIKNGKEHFNILTWTGTGTTNALTGLGFQPDLVWVKKRGDTTESHDLQDSIRGAGERLRTNSPDISRTIAGTIDSFDSDGFTVDDAGTTNESGKTYVAWCWKAGGTAVSNTDGSTTSTVSANTDAGFSIVKYTGTSANATVGHGLNSPPECIIFKDYTDLNEENWAIWFNGFNVSTGEHLAFNTSGLDTLSTLLNGTAPTSSVIHLGNNVLINDNGEDVIAYCWHSVEGYSKIGSFSGNANADGSFIYLGFRPAFFLWKRTDSTGTWGMIDSTRNTHNPLGQQLFPNTNDAEATYTICDFLSNGIKMRNSFGDTNTGTIAFLAFAENPFGGDNTAPATAR